MKKITLQDIASECGISRVTVWKALNNHTGVSASLRTKILNCAIQMGYPLNFRDSNMEPAQISTLLQNQKPYNIALVVSRPETSMFWGEIITNISECLKHLNTNMLFICLPITYSEDYLLPAELTDGTINGIIVMNIYESHLFRILNELPLPKVFLDSIPYIDFHNVNGDLFILEGRSTVETIVQHVISQGCRKIGFIGDINYAQTNYERYLGYCSAMNNNNIPILPEYCLTKSFGVNSYQYEINEFLGSFTVLPEMIVCASDYIAQLTIQQLMLMGYRIPKDIMISGFDDNYEFSHTKDLTTVHVQNANMGARLANQILYHLQYPDADYEFTYIRSNVIFRNSTGELPQL